MEIEAIEGILKKYNSLKKNESLTYKLSFMIGSHEAFATHSHEEGVYLDLTKNGKTLIITAKSVEENLVYEYDYINVEDITKIKISLYNI